MLKVWGRVNSINVMKVLWCLDELGVDYERIDAGMEHGVVDRPEYLAMNPNARVPTLEDGDFVLWESNVVVRYLSATYGAGSLCPEDPRQRALADQWMEWQRSDIEAAFFGVFVPLIRQPLDPARQGAIDQATARLNAQYQRLDGHLSRQPYLAGDDFTMGLFLLLPNVEYRDHRHPAPELYLNLTGPTQWRFDGGDWAEHHAGSIVWNPPERVHATRTGARPWLSFWAWLSDTDQPCEMVDLPDAAPR